VRALIEAYHGRQRSRVWEKKGKQKWPPVEKEAGQKFGFRNPGNGNLRANNSTDPKEGEG